MVIIKDFTRLEEFGFKKLPWKNEGHDVWEKGLIFDDLESIVSLLVNPFNNTPRGDFQYNEVVVYATSDEKKCLDAAVRPDVFMELIQAGVAEYVPDNKVKAVA